MSSTEKLNWHNQNFNTKKTKNLEIKRKKKYKKMMKHSTSFDYINEGNLAKS